MIKLSANLSKKAPMPDVEFSSQQYGAAMEIEVSDSAGSQEIASRLEAIYKLLERSIDSQLAAASKAPQPSTAEPPKRPFLDKPDGKPQPEGGNGNGASRRGNGHASPAQIRAMHAISKSKGMDHDALIRMLKSEYSAERPDDLTVKAASDLISKLQRMEGPRQ